MIPKNTSEEKEEFKTSLALIWMHFCYNMFYAKKKMK